MSLINQIKEVFGSTSQLSNTSSSAKPDADAPATAPTDQSEPVPQLPNSVVFDSSEVTVVFVLGGPGAGTDVHPPRLLLLITSLQARVLEDASSYSLRLAGDLLRAEQARPDSTFGAMIKEYITEGKIVPMEVTIKLLENAMRETFKSPPSGPPGVWDDGKGRFLIDGFPRKMDQALKYDEAVCQSSFVLFFATTEEVMLGRLLERGKTSGRDDDNKGSIVKRFRTFEETSMPVVDYYRARNKVVEIDSSPAVDEVYSNVKLAMDQRLDVGSILPNTAGMAADTQAPREFSTAPTSAPAYADTTEQSSENGGIPLLAAPVV
ncbi:MAG: hypothetical protein TREMPRED_004928 [Tremellales sp. Tagirdzhanova-0007]|nr:MAG: hypothetical protein TREMPRED_004928 [Tremellales sp. Tagirdzhanova-0007]